MPQLTAETDSPFADELERLMDEAEKTLIEINDMDRMRIASDLMTECVCAVFEAHLKHGLQSMEYQLANERLQRAHELARAVGVEK